MHQKRLPVHLHPRDADVSAAASTALHNVAMLRGEPGGHHIVNLAGHAPKPLGQVAALQLQHPVGLIQSLLNESCYQI